MDNDLLDTNNINQDFTLNNNINQGFTLNNNNILEDNTKFIQEHQNKLREEFSKNKTYIQNPNTKDLFEDNYKKLKYNYINIDSQNQDKLNNVRINLEKPLTNIYSISLKDINLPYTSQPIHENNNIIQWKYAKDSDYNCENQLNPNSSVKKLINQFDSFRFFLALERRSGTVSVQNRSSQPCRHQIVSYLLLILLIFLMFT